jgi:hypothetical protein
LVYITYSKLYYFQICCFLIEKYFWKENIEIWKNILFVEIKIGLITNYNNPMLFWAFGMTANPPSSPFSHFEATQLDEPHF